MTREEVKQLSDDNKNYLIHKLSGPQLYFVVKPKYDPYGYYRVGGHGYTAHNDKEAWRVTKEEGEKYTLYADEKYGTDKFYERVILEPVPAPNYLEDLNEVANIEEMLSDEKKIEMHNTFFLNWSARELPHIWRATARQRVDALIMINY